MNYFASVDLLGETPNAPSYHIAPHLFLCPRYAEAQNALVDILLLAEVCV